MVPWVPGVLGAAVLAATLMAILVGAKQLAAQQTDRAFPALHRQTFEAPAAAELIATLTVRCDQCAWDVEGREAVVLSVGLDGNSLVALPVTRTGRAQYSVFLGRLAPGTHRLQLDQLEHATAARLRHRHTAAVEAIAMTQVNSDQPEYEPLSFAPFIYTRPDTIGRFTDVPLLMWHEIEPTPRGKRYRYSVVFSNEDGGTPADRLMAAWGRTTDIEYIYSVEVNDKGEILHEDMQGPEHEILPYRGSRVHGRHPELWVATDNNMVRDRGTTRVRYAPAPVPVTLTHASREAVMDANPWSYEVMARELAREGKIIPDAPPGQGAIPDPRRFAYLEGCGTVADHALAFAVRVDEEWISSDRGLPEYRIARDGCFRAAVPLPGTAGVRDIRAVRVQAFPRPGKPSSIPVRFTRVNTLFGLDDRYAPGPRLVSWEGSIDLHPGGPPLEIPVR